MVALHEVSAVRARLPAASQGAHIRMSRLLPMWPEGDAPSYLYDSCIYGVTCTFRLRGRQGGALALPFMTGLATSVDGAPGVSDRATEDRDEHWESPMHSLETLISHYQVATVAELMQQLDVRYAGKRYLSNGKHFNTILEALNAAHTHRSNAVARELNQEPKAMTTQPLRQAEPTEDSMVGFANLVAWIHMSLSGVIGAMLMFTFGENGALFGLGVLMQGCLVFVGLQLLAGIAHDIRIIRFRVTLADSK